MLGPKPPSPFDPSCLRVAADLRRLGIEPTDGGYHPVRHGVWIRKEVWEDLNRDHRYAAFVHATALRCDPDKPPLFSHESAAALWGFPIIGAWPRRCHVTYVGRYVRSSGLIVRHLATASVETLQGGVRVTSPAQTVADLAGTAPLTSALAAADHALRHGLCSREELGAVVDAIPAATEGVVQARLVRDLADPLSMSAGESLSRAQMFVLNLPRPRLQVTHSDERGFVGMVDFDWDGVIGEFDGKVKYGVPEDGSAQLAADTLWAEKQREDRLRRRGLRMARWTWADALDPDRLARILAAEGIRSQPRNSWLSPGTPRRSA
jgi:hypothetical protein